MPVVSCPTCGMKLEVLPGDVGHKVECSGCQATFTAATGSSPDGDGDGEGKKKPYSYRRERDDDDDDDRPSRRRRDDDYDDGDDPDADYRPSRRGRRRSYDDRDYDYRYGGGARQSGKGQTAMILGIVSLAMLLVVPAASLVTAIIGVVYGSIGLKTQERKQAMTGLICSLVTLVLMLVLTALVVAWIVYLSSMAAVPPAAGPPPVATPSTFRGGRF